MALIFKNSFLIGCVGVILASCADIPVEPASPTQGEEAREQRDRERYGTIWGGDGITLFSTSRRRDADDAGGGGGIGVNAFIWQATLDTIDFMPLASADPFGGLIITDWYQSVDAPGERLKLHVQIRDSALRADTVRVSVFRQVRSDEGDWLNAAVEETTARSLEDHILTRARELRVASTAAG